MIRIAFAALLLASAAFAGEFAFVPPNPTPHTSVDAIVNSEYGGCEPKGIGISLSGSTITLRMGADPPPGSSCYAGNRPFRMAFHLGILPAGSYTVAATVEAAGITREVGRAPLIVRDDESLFIQPYAVPVSGGKVAVLANAPIFGGTVSVDGVTVPLSFPGGPDPAPIFNVPPHAPGAVDVTLKAETTIFTAKSGLVYYEPGSVEPALFEPILFPLSYDGPGAFGSQWTTENVMDWAERTYFRDPPPCDACSNQPTTGIKHLRNDNQPWGRVLYALRGTIDSAVFASRARDVSQARSAGVEIPVVRESDFRSRSVLMINVPSDSRFRVMLRVWTLNDVGFVDVKIRTFSLLIPTIRIPGTSVSFASADITLPLRQHQSGPVLILGDDGSLPNASLWAMISVTNNETQDVTIISSR